MWTKIVLRLSLTVLAILSAAVSLSAQTARKPSPSAEAEFKPIIQRYYAAWSNLNTDEPAQFYAKDPELVFFDVAPFQYKGWSEYKAGVQKNFFDPAVSAKLIPNDDLKAKRRGNVAWTTITFHLSAKLKDGNSMELDGRHTAIWEKRSGKWLIVHEHISAPLPSQ